MKSLRSYLDKIKPHFEKGGKYEKFGSTFEAFESFMFVPNKVTSKGTHIRVGNDMKRAMAIVVLALIPSLLFGMWNIGYQHFMATGQEGTFFQFFWTGFLQVFPIIVVSYVVGLGIEFAFAQYRGHEVNEGFLVSGILIPLVLPADIPLWMVAIATAFAVVIGKEVFGGTGMNILNPALTARAFLFFAYPSYMSGNAVWTHGMLKGEGIIDSYTGATPLAEAAAGNMDKLPDVSEMFFGTILGSIGETSTLAILIGAAILLITGIGSARIMISTVIGGLVMGYLLNIFAVNPFMELEGWKHLLLGGFAFGAVFMATDPVSAAQTPRGKIIYGFLIGSLSILIRVLNPAYPEGVMLAILLMNVFAPLIDHYVIEANIKKRLRRAKVKA